VVVDLAVESFARRRGLAGFVDQVGQARGAGGGQVTAGWGRLPGGCELLVCYGHTIADLHDVVALAEQNVLRIETEAFPFAKVDEAYQRLRAGTLTGRALVTTG
jgi:alcohol dehydrogenase, propanol-preferring